MTPPSHSSVFFLRLIEGIGKEQQETDLRALRLLEEALRSPELRMLRMQWMLLSPDKRTDIFFNALSPWMTERVVRIVSEWTASNGLDTLSAFIESYVHFREVHGLGIEATVVSSEPLDSEKRERIVQGLSRFLGQPIVLHESLDVSLHGGFRLMIKDWMYDGSMRGRLQRLLQHLSS